MEVSEQLDIGTTHLSRHIVLQHDSPSALDNLMVCFPPHSYIHMHPE